MPTVTLSYVDLTTQPLPPVCILCGAPAAGTYPRSLAGRVSNTGGSGPAAEVRFTAPLCRTHIDCPFGRGAGANALLVAATLLFIGGMALAAMTRVPEWGLLSGIGFLALLVVGIVTRPALRAEVNAWPNPTRVTLIGAAAAFAAGMGESVRRIARPPLTARRATGTVLTYGGAAVAVGSGFLVAAVIYASMKSGREAGRIQQEVAEDQLRQITRSSIFRDPPETRAARSRDRAAELEAERRTRTWASAVLILVGSVGGVGGVLLRRAGKRLAMPSVAELLAADPRPPVLYLRAFDDDEAGHQAEFTVPWVGGQKLPTGFGASGEQTTFEELLAGELSWLGPVVAIGRPGDSRALPRVGAARMWVEDADWRDVVRGFMPRARMVVLLLGRIRGENGLAWEWAQLQAIAPPEQLLLVMPPVAAAEARERWAGFEQRAAGRLPAYREGLIAARFGPGWECRLFVAAEPVGKPAEYRAAVVEADPAAGWVVVSSNPTSADIAGRPNPCT